MAKSKALEIVEEQVSVEKQVEEVPQIKMVKFFNPTAGNLSFIVKDGVEFSMIGNSTRYVSEEDATFLEGTVLVRLPD